MSPSFFEQHDYRVIESPLNLASNQMAQDTLLIRVWKMDRMIFMTDGQIDRDGILKKQPTTGKAEISKGAMVPIQIRRSRYETGESEKYNGSEWSSSVPSTRYSIFWPSVTVVEYKATTRAIFKHLRSNERTPQIDLPRFSF